VTAWDDLIEASDAEDGDAWTRLQSLSSGGGVTYVTECSANIASSELSGAIEDQTLDANIVVAVLAAAIESTAMLATADDNELGGNIEVL
jgi:hypothetical protein